MSPLAPQPQRPDANGGCRSARSAKIGEMGVPGCSPRVSRDAVGTADFPRMVSKVLPHDALSQVIEIHYRAV